MSDNFLDEIRNSYKGDEPCEYYYNLKVGDTVTIECYTGMGTGGESTITAIKTKYNEDTGEPYPIIVCGDQEFNGEHGYALTPPIMYFIASRDE